MSEKKASFQPLDVRRNASRLKVIRPVQQMDLNLELGLKGAEQRRESDWYFTSPLFLFQTCLPYTQLEETDLVNGAWERRNGAMTMKVTTALRDPTRIPCGKLPRQFLMWLTNALALSPQSIAECSPDSDHPTGTKVFHINTTMAEFCRSVGVDPSTGKNGSGRALVEQMIRVMAASFSIAREEKTAEGVQRLAIRRLNVTSALSLSWNDAAPSPSQLLKSLDGGFLLSLDFYDEVVTKRRRMVLPHDHVSRICKGKSPLRIDVYHFVMQKNWYLHQANKSMMVIPWNELFTQFGSTGTLVEFMRAFRSEVCWINKNLLPKFAPKIDDHKLLTLYRFDHPVPLMRKQHALEVKKG